MRDRVALVIIVIVFVAITFAVEYIKDTIKGFNMIMDGELDHLPEAAFNLKGTIEEAIEAGEKMLAEAQV